MITRSRQGLVLATSLLMLLSWLTLPVGAAMPGSMPQRHSMLCDGADPLQHDHVRDCTGGCSSLPDQVHESGSMAGAYRSPTPGDLAGVIAQPDLPLRCIARTVSSPPRAPPLITTATPVARHDILLD
ncbi:MAG: hypothetical protein QNJ73_03010 [Gammaproteobacteria bacterium]|nr:hypothetical protein [Gammaproteobacteria bacterium]